MKKLILLFSLGLVCLQLSAQRYPWLREFGLSAEIHEINEAPGGSIIVGGEFSEMTFLGTTYRAGASGQNGFIASLSATGEEQWIKIIENIPNSSTSNARVDFLAMESDASGNIYAMGLTLGREVRYEGTTILDERGGHFLIKIDKTGDLVSHISDFSFSVLDNLNGNENVRLSDIAVSPTGELHVALNFWGAFNFNGVEYSTFSSRYDAFILKYNADGTKAWGEHPRSSWDETPSYPERAIQLELDAVGNVWAACNFIKPSGGDAGLRLGDFTLPPIQQGRGAYLIKIAANGTPQLATLLADDDQAPLSGIQNEICMDLEALESDVLLSINFSDNVIIDTAKIINPSANRGTNAVDGNVIARLDNDGKLIWHKIFVGRDAVPQLAVDPITEQVSVLASYTNAFFPEEDIRLLDNGQDYFIADFDDTGSLVRIDSSEYSITLPINTDQHPIEYFSDGKLVFGMEFNRAGTMQIGDKTTSNPHAVLVTRNALRPFIVNLGPDLGQCQGEVTLDAGSFDGATYLWSTGAQTQTITVTQSGTYSVQVVNTEQETATDEVLITIDEPLIFDLPNDVFGTSKVILTVPINAFAYQWSTGETTQSITVNTSGTYSVTAHTEFGCETSDDVIVTIGEINIFKGGAGSGDATGQLDNNSSVLYTGGTGSGYVGGVLENNNAFYAGSEGSGYTTTSFINNIPAFYFGSAGSGHAFNASAIDSRAFYLGGEGGGYTMSFFDGVALSISAPVNLNIQVYPNPVASQLFIDRSELTLDKGTLRIFHTGGQLVHEQILQDSSNVIQLDVSAFKSGVYLMEYYSKTKKQRQTFKLVVQ